MAGSDAGVNPTDAALGSEQEIIPPWTTPKAESHPKATPNRAHTVARTVRREAGLLVLHAPATPGGDTPPFPTPAIAPKPERARTSTTAQLLNPHLQSSPKHDERDLDRKERIKGPLETRPVLSCPMPALPKAMAVPRWHSPFPWKRV